jgi:erythromycin esterase-like protein
MLFVAATLLAGGVAASEEEAAPLETRDCPAVPGIETVLSSARVILIGELHGTVESPAFVAAVACRALESGRSVRVGLEWVETESDRVEAYLQSDGGPPARSALLAGAIWQERGQAQYGATSAAMLELLDSLRERVGSGSNLGVFLFNRFGTASSDRERLMAEALGRQLAASPDDLFVVLTGNIHSRLAPGTPWDPDYQPMGLLLQQALPDLDIVSLDVAHAGGSAWMCVSGESCGARRQGPRGEAGPRFAISLDEEIQSYGHHGRYFVGEIHASPPAVSE